jgi:hypothetical protein
MISTVLKILLRAKDNTPKQNLQRYSERKQTMPNIKAIPYNVELKPYPAKNINIIKILSVDAINYSGKQMSQCLVI